MALQKQNVFISFEKGVDNSRDPKLVIPSKFTRLDNLSFSDRNTVRQRPGFAKKTLTPVTNTPAVANVRRLMALGAEVLLESDTGFHTFLQDHVASRDECGDGNIPTRIKTFERAQVDYTDVASSQRDQFDFDVALHTASGLECWVWTENPIASPTLPSIFYKVIDSASRAIVQQGTVFYDNSLVAKAYHPRVVCRDAGGNIRFYIFYTRTDVATGAVFSLEQKYLEITLGTKVPGALSAGVDPLNGDLLSSAGVFDAVYSDATNDKIAIGYRDASNDFAMRVLNGSDGATCPFGSVTGAHLNAAAVSVVILKNAGTYYAVGTYQVGTNFLYSTSITTAGLAQVDNTLATPTAPGRISSLVSPFDGTKAMVFYDLNPYTAVVNAFSNDVGFVGMTYQGAAVGGSESTFARGLVLAAKPVAYYSTAGLPDVCVPTALLSDLQPTIFALKFGGAALAAGFGNPNSFTSPRVLARIHPSECGSLKAHYAGGLRIPTCLGGTAASVKLPFTKLGKPQFENAVNVTPSRLALATLNFQLSLPSFETQRSLFLTGACPMLYDGEILHEAGFHYYPEGLAGTAAGGGGSLTAGTYSALIVYEWEDAKGVLHQSDASVPASAVAVLNGHITWAFPYLRLTDKQGVDDGAAEHRSNVRIVLYRTVANGTIYYRETAVLTGQGCLNRLSLNAAGSWVSTQSDASLVSGELVYTTGGSLGHDAFPSTSIAFMHQNRLFMVMQEEQSWVQYTDEIDERFLAPATSEIYRLRVPPEAGKVLAGGSMDGKIFLVCEKMIGGYFGDGPNRLGQQNGYSEFEPISSVMGGLAGAQEAVVFSSSEGMWFMTPSGLRLISRGGGIAMMPDDPEAFRGSEMDAEFATLPSSIKALVIPTQSEIRWYLGGSSTVIVFNYEQNQWSKLTSLNSNGGATVARGQFWHSDGTNLFECALTPGGLDDAALTAMVLETAWFNLAGVQGYQRVYSLMLLAQAMSGCTVQVEEGFDYTDAYVSSGTVSRTGWDATQIPFTNADGFSGSNGTTVRGATSGAVGTITGSTASNPANGASGTIWVVNALGTPNFINGETLTGFGATAGVVTKGVLVLGNPPAVGVLVTGTSGSGTVSAVVSTTTGGYSFCTLTGIAGHFNPSADVTFPQAFTYAVSGASNPLQLEHKLSKQVCEAFRFRLTITPGSAAEAVRLTNFGLSIGMKRGLFKLPSAQRF